MLPMGHLAHRLVVAAMCIAMTCSSVMAGKVLCRGEGGHQAIEPAHALGHCPSASNSHSHSEGEGSAPCQDLPLGNDHAMQAARVVTVNFGTAYVLPLCLIPPDVAEATACSSLSPPSISGSLAPHSGGAQLRTVVLLI